MSYDYKFAIMERAEQAAADMGWEYYDLPEDMQNTIYNQAAEAEHNSLMAKADAMRDRMAESNIGVK